MWLVAEAGTATKRLREQQAYGEQLQIALNRALADHPRVEAERDTLQGTFSSQTEQHA